MSDSVTVTELEDESAGLPLGVSDGAYDRYVNKKEPVSNSRIRPDDQDIFDALLSVDMGRQERRESLEAIGEY